MVREASCARSTRARSAAVCGTARRLARRGAGRTGTSANASRNVCSAPTTERECRATSAVPHKCVRVLVIPRDPEAFSVKQLGDDNWLF